MEQVHKNEKKINNSSGIYDTMHPNGYEMNGSSYFEISD